MKRFIYTLMLLSCSSISHAEILVLVHGWSANANTWIQSGVIPTLAANGWNNAGIVISLPNYRINYIPAHGEKADNKVYRVHLPAEAPLHIQASHLLGELNFIHNLYPAEKINLAGHSAGGIVARLSLIKASNLPIISLTTIASPNLGTPRALEGLDIVEGKPFFCPGPGMDIAKTFIGGNNYRYLKNSRGALIDLRPATLDSLIGWLNFQPHPEIQYHSIIRQGSADDIVPQYSQDLNQAPALQGKAQIYLTPTDHSLKAADGQLLADILNR